MQPEKRDYLLEQLQAWGHATVCRYAANREGSSIGEHILARNRDLAPGTKERAERVLVGRDGQDRRRLMAGKVGMKKLRIVPMWACDPVPARNDADPPRDRAPDRGAVVDMGIPDELLWIDRAVIQMARVNLVWSLVLREEFTGRGTHSAKAQAVQRQYDGTLSVRQYRDALRRAMDWMRGRMAA